MVFLLGLSVNQPNSSSQTTVINHFLFYNAYSFFMFFLWNCHYVSRKWSETVPYNSGSVTSFGTAADSDSDSPSSFKRRYFSSSSISYSFASMSFAGSSSISSPLDIFPDVNPCYVNAYHFVKSSLCKFRKCG